LLNLESSNGASITVPHSMMLERILSLEIVRVTERAAVARRGCAGAARKRPPTRPPSTPCGASSTSCRSTAPS
jgi:hypothetical protein